MKRSRHPLSPLTLELLRLSDAYVDFHAWRQVAERVTSTYSPHVINRGLSRLSHEGFIRSTGSPTAGWLTERGRAALAAWLG